jgi:hypothetical protein
MISQVDPEARHARKNQRTGVDGYRAHLAAEPSTGIITDEELTQAAGDDNSDAAAAARFVAREHAARPAAGDAGADGPDQEAAGQDSEQPSWYCDSAYGTGELRQAIADAGDTAVIKPKTLRPPAAGPGGFTIDDFTPDEDAGTVTCPAGVRRIVTFGAACRGCPLRSQCTTNKAGRSLVLHPHDRLLRAARRDWAASKDLRKDYRSWSLTRQDRPARVAEPRYSRRCRSPGSGDRAGPGVGRASWRRFRARTPS